MREAKEQAHSMYLLQQKRLNLIVANAHREALREWTRKSNFKKLCLEPFAKHQAAWDKLDSILQDELNTRLVGMSMENFESKLDELYSKVVTKALENVCAKGRTDERNAKTKQKVDKATGETTPLKAFDKITETKVNTRVHKHVRSLLASPHRDPKAKSDTSPGKAGVSSKGKGKDATNGRAKKRQEKARPKARAKARQTNHRTRSFHRKTEQKAAKVVGVEAKAEARKDAEC